MKKLLKKKFKNTNFKGSFILYSFKEDLGYAVDKIIGRYFRYLNSREGYGGTKFLSGYHLEEGDNIYSIEATHTKEKITLDSNDKYQSKLNSFLSKLKPNTEIEICYERKINNETLKRSVIILTENWSEYKKANLSLYNNWPEIKKKYLIKKFENQYFEGYPDFTDEVANKVFTEVLTLDEKLEKIDLRKEEFKYLNLYRSFLPLEIIYNHVSGAYEVKAIIDQYYALDKSSILEENINSEFDQNKHTNELDLLMVGDNIISLESEVANSKVSLINNDKNKSLHQFLGNLRIKSWVKVEIRRNDKHFFYWIVTTNLEDYLINFDHVFMKWQFGSNFIERFDLDVVPYISNNNANEKYKESLLKGNEGFKLRDFYEKNFDLISNEIKELKPIKSSLYPLTDVYFLHMLYVDVAEVYLKDLEEWHPNELVWEGTGWWDNKTIDKPNKKFNALKIRNSADGLYPFYVGVDKYNKINKIFAETQINEYGHRHKPLQSKTYPLYPSYKWGQSIFDSQFFSIKKNKEIKKRQRIKLFDLNITSNFLILSDDNEHMYEHPEELKARYNKMYHSKSSIPTSGKQAFPINNGTYPVYLHCYEKIEKENPYLDEEFHIKIVIEDIHGCYLNKDKDGSLVLQRELLPSLAFEEQIKNRVKTAYVDKIDLRDSSSLKIIEKLKDVEILKLCGLENIEDCSSLYKLKKLKKLYLIDCGFINLKKENSFEVIKKD